MGEYGPDTQKLLARLEEYKSRWTRICGYNTEDLDISDLDVHSLPYIPPVRAFAVYNKKLRSLPELPMGLRELDILGGPIDRLPALPKSLRELHVCGCTNLKRFPPLNEGLVWLNCCDSGIVELPTLPSTLRQLLCRNTPLSRLPPLPKLYALEISNTQVTLLPNLPVETLGFFKMHGTPLLILPLSNETHAEYNKRWIPIREEIESRERTRARTRVLYHDIIAAAWHPRRFQDWCLDEDDKRETHELVQMSYAVHR
jgi:hypothetical protein